MKINLTKKEYRTLLELLYLGDWVMTSRSEDPEADYPEHHILLQKFYSLASEFEADDDVEYYKEPEQYLPSDAFEEAAQAKYVEDYDTEIFWTTLMNQLVMGEIQATIGEEGFDKLDDDGKIKLYDQLEEKFTDLIQQQGFASLTTNNDATETEATAH